ncbi:MAG: sensor histidine kinase [Oscillospiraceae bacterium]
MELAWERQRQFVADASHELKTPLTVILSNAQLLGEAEGDPALRSRLRENILSMSARMRSLVESLLDLARVDSGLAGQTLSRVDLSRVVSEAILPFEPLFYERGQALSSEIEPGIAVKGSAERLSQAVGVLLDNAQKYASPGGSVSVTLSRQGGRHRLHSGGKQRRALSLPSGATSSSAFTRGRARAQAGAGLGLSIARGIVEAHRGPSGPRPSPAATDSAYGSEFKNQNESAAAHPAALSFFINRLRFTPRAFQLCFSQPCYIGTVRGYRLD